MKTRKNAATKEAHAPQTWTGTVWESFSGDQSLRKAHAITDAEMRALQRVSLLGKILSKQDYIFILNQVRSAR